MTSATEFNILDGTGDWWARLSLAQQFEHLNSDPGYQRKLLAGDAEARAIFQHTSERMVEWNRQEAARELADAVAAHNETVKKLSE